MQLKSEAHEGPPPQLAGSHVWPVVARKDNYSGDHPTPTQGGTVTPDPGGSPPKLAGRQFGPILDEDDRSIGDHPTPTQEGKVTPWWKRGGTRGMEKQSLGGTIKKKKGSLSSNGASPTPSMKNSTKLKKATVPQTTKLGRGASGTLQLVRGKAGGGGSSDLKMKMSNVSNEDDLRNDMMKDDGMKHECVKTTFQSMDNQDLPDEMVGCPNRQLVTNFNLTNESGSAGNEG